MQNKYATLEELWSRQQLKEADIDYNQWNIQKQTLSKLSDMSGSCMFTVDVFKCRYTFLSKNFADIFGYDPLKIEKIEEQGDYLESRIHPDDRDEMLDIQIGLSQFIYSLPSTERNNYRNNYQFRVLNSQNNYVNVISRQQVLLQDKNQKACIIMGVMDISPDQSPLGHVKCSVLHQNTGQVFTPSTLSGNCIHLTQREKEILSLIREGALSKEIADRLQISIHTVNNHRKNILGKLHVDNAIEAINMAKKYGLD